MTTQIKKPSEILREMPRDKWMRNGYTDGQGHYCAAGWLGKEAGAEFYADPQIEGEYNMSLGDDSGMEAVYGHYGIPDMIYMAILNDWHGLDAVIAALDAVGM